MTLATRSCNQWRPRNVGRDRSVTKGEPQMLIRFPLEIEQLKPHRDWTQIGEWFGRVCFVVTILILIYFT